MPELGFRKDGDVVFADREDAGRILAERLASLNLKDPLVLAIPKGGLPVAQEIARRLGAPLGIIAVLKEKVANGNQPARGAQAEGGEPVFDKACFASLGEGRQELGELVLKLKHGLTRLLMFYGPGHCLPSLKGRTVILVDDGVHSGWTVRAGLARIRHDEPSKLVLAVPVIPEYLVEELSRLVDHLVCPHQPKYLVNIGEWYGDFSGVSEVDALKILGANRHPDSGAGHGSQI